MNYVNWLSEWLTNYVKPGYKSRTYERYSQTVETHITPKLGSFELDELSVGVLQKFVCDLLEDGNKRTGKGLSANSVNGIISVLQSSLKTAYASGVTKDYVADKINRPKIAEKQISSFSMKEQKKIERAIMCSRKPKMFGIILCLYTGLRIGELLALEWKDIDVKRGVMCVSKTCHDCSGNGMTVKVVGTPKTTSSRRIIPLPKQLVPVLKMLKKNNKCAFVISDNNMPVSVRSYQRSFELLLKKLNIPHKGFHALRHTFATRAIECGMDVKTLSELLGHKNTNITLNRYAHSLTEHKTEVMNKLGKIF